MTDGITKIKTAKSQRDEALAQLEERKKEIYTEFVDDVRTAMSDGVTSQQAAEALGVQRSGLYELFNRYGKTTA